VDTTENPATNVSGVLFNNCIVYGWGLAGLLINNGSDIVVAGGQYSGNGQAGGTHDALAGIAVAGGELVTISGVDCSGTSQLGHAGSPTTQPYGIAVFNGGNATITNCNLTGNSSEALHTNAPGTLEVTNCTGYNDQATLLSSSAPSGTFSALTYNYYGPVAFYASGGSAVQVVINTHNTGLTSGGFTLSPGEAAAFALGVGGHLPTTFYMFGK
jgi:hypothetical protein